MRTRPLLAILILAASPALAGTEIEIGPGVCDRLVNYVEPPGVEYQPGVDATGNPVAPADADGQKPLKLPSRIVIPITDELAARLTAGTGNAASAAVVPQAFLGTVTLEGSQLMFNGQPLGSNVDGDLGILCAKGRRAN